VGTDRDGDRAGVFQNDGLGAGSGFGLKSRLVVRPLPRQRSGERQDDATNPRSSLKKL
jgi:hypothetical protein